MTDREQEFGEFFTAEFEPLCRLGFLLTGNWDEAEELAQEAMVRTYLAWSRIRQRERPRMYARSVLVNRQRSLFRRARVAQRHNVESQLEANRPDLSEDGIFLWDALRSLPQRQRAALVLRFYEDLTGPEIAHILEVPLGTVKTLVHRGLTRLRDRLGSAWLGSGVAGNRRE